MFKTIHHKTLQISAGFTAGLLGTTSDAHAANTCTSGNNFNCIAENILSSADQLPGLLTGLSYMLGVLLGTMGVLKIKDHVEAPQQTSMKEGIIRLIVGGGLFSLPIVYEAMSNSVGDTTAVVQAPTLNKAGFNIN